MGSPSNMAATAWAMRVEVAACPSRKLVESRQHDAAYDAVRQVFAEGDGRGKGLDARVSIALFHGESLTCGLSHGGGDAVDHHRGVALDHFEEAGAAGGNSLQCGIGYSDGFSLPGDAEEGV